MIKTKRVVAAVLAVLTLFNLTSCGGKAENTNKGLSDRTAAQTEFKRNGNNDVVADILKDKTGADVFQIITKQQY